MATPRKLTFEEIEDIVSVIGSDSEVSVRSPVQDITDTVNEAIRKKLRDDLSKINITPLGIPDLKEATRHYFIRSKAVPGTPVGYQVSESIGGPTTQMSLNAFHTAGSGSDSSQGIERIQQLIDLTKKPKVIVTQTHFHEHLDYEMAYTKIRREILDVSVGSLVEEYDIENIEFITQDRPWWYDLYEEIYSEIPEIDYILRLNLNVKNMVAFGVTMEEVAEAIERGNASTIKAVFSPLNIGIVDIYPIRETLIDRLQGEGQGSLYMENAANIFLNSIVVDKLDDLHIKGIPGAKKAFPQSTPVLNILEEEFPYPEEKNVWVLRLSRRRMFISGVTKDKLVNLISLIPSLQVVEVEDEQPDYIIVYSEEGKPWDVIKKTLADKNTASRIINASQYYFIEIQGGKYVDILSLDDVRPELTVSNNIHDIYEVLGVEAARKFYIREFYNLFVLQDLYVFAGHLELMADFVTNMGILSAINTTGIGRQAIGSLAKATYRKPMDILYRAGSAGEVNDIRSVSASVLLGQRPRIGTGYVDLLPDKRREEELLSTLRRPEAQIASTDFSNSIDQLSDLVTGDKVFTVSDADLDLMFAGPNAPPLTTSYLGTAITRIGPTPEVEPLEQIRPLKVVSEQLLEVAPALEQQIEKEERREEEEIVPVSVPPRFRLPSLGGGFSFTRTALPIREREVTLRSTEELLSELER
ncbi:DNA-directed RNA polymerase RPB1 [Cedratvirus lausannensis]|uniref:DNA-directed RNA polymerase n=1 Tax=Cedratvirus lausannensis TaxID=2023205 RepID=A0A285PXU1_9VIRU|nr:DNA-directed RNA polymerase [Cedratvirus borely]WIL03656.1 DNA-directed RNA polymerase [Cedratvirus plubellavi]SOB74454.1 DNA-directed RNA polymerase RPB1 [Cedratvirus lausannensis]